MRVTGIVLHRVGIALLCLVGGAAQAAGVASGSDADCASAHARLIDDAIIDVVGQARVTRSVNIRAGEIVLISATEKGIDVRLEIALTPRERRTADSPIARSGPQRLLLESGAARKVEIALLGK